jgi:hypothetical protein
MAVFTADQNDGAHVFVFGSNLRGRHGKGAALTAATSWGAEEGVGSGRTGMAYAIPTKIHPYQVLSVPVIGRHIERFLDYAAAHPDLTFLVTPIGCGLAGFTAEQIAPYFAGAPENCQLPQEFLDVIRSFT